MALSYREMFRVESDHLAAAAKSVLEHKTGRGDHREALLRDFVRHRIGSAFAIDKGEIVDSQGKTTGEYDAIIYDNRTTAALAVEGDRKVIRVEAVVATVEVKSSLEGSHLKDLFAHGNKELLQLLRFYAPTQELRLLSALGQVKGDERRAGTQKAFAEGLNAMSHHESIPRIVSLVFGFNGCTKEKAAEHLWLDGVDAVCVLGAYTAAKTSLGFPDNPSSLVLWAEGADALGAFLFLIEECLENYLEGRRWVSPSWQRYFMQPAALLRAGAVTP